MDERYTPRRMSHSEPPPEAAQLNEPAFALLFRSHPKIEWQDQSGRYGRLIEGRVVVGSAQGSGIVIQDPTVSRLHAEFEARDDGLWVRDLGSRNGTWVEGPELTDARLPPGAPVRGGAP